MNAKMLGLFVGFLGLIAWTNAEYNPCKGKALLNEKCDVREDCEDSLGVDCFRGLCRCHNDYELITDKENERNYCRKLPDDIDAPCESRCRAPLFCRQRKCVCLNRGNTRVVDGECQLVTKIGDGCTRHTDCTEPFSACIGKKCACVGGLANRGGACVAEPRCPDGANPLQGKHCVRRESDQHVIENMVNSGGSADNCTFGYYCVTAEGSTIGHCCPASCPLNTEPLKRYSCETGAANACPDTTHYCHRVSGPGYSSAVCCKAPCAKAAPAAIYIKGKCYPRAFLNSPCTRHEQCDNYQSMTCNSGTCQCRAGYRMKIGAFTNVKDNPAQVCEKSDCPSSAAEKGNKCFPKVFKLRGQCAIQEQCPRTTGCYRGQCVCKCGYNEENGLCVKVEPTTTPKPTGPVGGLVTTKTPDFLKIIQGLLGGKGLGSLGNNPSG